MSDNTYNGWSNRETWLVNVWFNPESIEDVDFAQSHIEETYDNLPDFMKDFVDISCINWDELKSCFEEDSDDENEEDNED